MGRGKGGSTSHGKRTPGGIRTTSAMRSDGGAVELGKESQDSRLEGWKQRMSPEVIKGLARAYGDGEYKLGKKASDVDELSAASNLVDSTIDRLISVAKEEYGAEFGEEMEKLRNGLHIKLDIEGDVVDSDALAHYSRVNNEIVFGKNHVEVFVGERELSSDGMQRVKKTLAHELAHMLQGGSVKQQPGSLRVLNELGAELLAQQVSPTERLSYDSLIYQLVNDTANRLDIDVNEAKRLLISADFGNKEAYEKIKALPFMQPEVIEDPKKYDDLARFLQYYSRHGESDNMDWSDFYVDKDDHSLRDARNKANLYALLGKEMGLSADLPPERDIEQTSRYNVMPYLLSRLDNATVDDVGMEAFDSIQEEFRELHDMAALLYRSPKELINNSAVKTKLGELKSRIVDKLKSEPKYDKWQKTFADAMDFFISRDAMGIEQAQDAAVDGLVSSFEQSEPVIDSVSSLLKKYARRSVGLPSSSSLVARENNVDVLFSGDNIVFEDGAFNKKVEEMGSSLIDALGHDWADKIQKEIESFNQYGLTLADINNKANKVAEYQGDRMTINGQAVKHLAESLRNGSELDVSKLEGVRKEFQVAAAKEIVNGLMPKHRVDNEDLVRAASELLVGLMVDDYKGNENLVRLKIAGILVENPGMSLQEAVKALLDKGLKGQDIDGANAFTRNNDLQFSEADYFKVKEIHDALASGVKKYQEATNLAEMMGGVNDLVVYAESQFDDSMWKQHGTKTGNRVVPPSLADIKSASKGQDVAKPKIFNAAAYKEGKDATMYGRNNKYDMASHVPSFGAWHLKTGFEKMLKRMKPEKSEAFVKDNILYQKIQEPLTRFVNTLGDFSPAGQEKLAALRADIESRVVDTPYVKEMRAILDGALKSAEKKEKARERRTQKNLEKLKKEAKAVDVGNKW